MTDDFVSQSYELSRQLEFFIVSTESLKGEDIHIREKAIVEDESYFAIAVSCSNFSQDLHRDGRFRLQSIGKSLAVSELVRVILAEILVVLPRPFAVFDEIVFENLHSFVINVFSSEELSFFVHSHIYSDVSVKTENDQGFVVLF